MDPACNPKTVQYRTLSDRDRNLSTLHPFLFLGNVTFNNFPLGITKCAGLRVHRYLVALPSVNLFCIVYLGGRFDSDRSSLGLLFYCSQQGKIVAYPHQFRKTKRELPTPTSAIKRLYKQKFFCSYMKCCKWRYYKCLRCLLVKMIETHTRWIEFWKAGHQWLRSCLDFFCKGFSYWIVSVSFSHSCITKWK